MCLSLLPTRIKRLIFISSLIPIITKVDITDISKAIEVNSLFSIAKHPKTIILFSKLSKCLWANLSIDKDILHEYLSSKKGRYLPISKITNYTPKWLRYGSNELVLCDVFKLSFLPL